MSKHRKSEAIFHTKRIAIVSVLGAIGLFTIISLGGETFLQGVVSNRGNDCPSDADADGICDDDDLCPNDAMNDADRDDVCGDVDNCPGIANTDQTDIDPWNGTGDACEEHCGDGTVNESEECDDGKNCADGSACTSNEDCGGGEYACVPRDGGGCNATCFSEICGNSNIDIGEECDTGSLNDDTSGCTTLCKNAFCGDYYTQTGVEECDDGNTTTGDGCSDICENECPHDLVALREAVNNALLDANDADAAADVADQEASIAATNEADARAAYELADANVTVAEQAANDALVAHRTLWTAWETLLGQRRNANLTVAAARWTLATAIEEGRPPNVIQAQRNNLDTRLAERDGIDALIPAAQAATNEAWTIVEARQAEAAAARTISLGLHDAHSLAYSDLAAAESRAIDALMLLNNALVQYRQAQADLAAAESECSDPAPPSPAPLACEWWDFLCEE